jgi:hypothetical protein
MQPIRCALRCRSGPSGRRRERTGAGFDDMGSQSCLPTRSPFRRKCLAQEIPCSGQAIPCSAKKILSSEKNRESSARPSNRCTISGQPAPNGPSRPKFPKFPAIFPVFRESVHHGSALILASRMICFHRATSGPIIWANSAGVFATGTKPSVASRSCRSGVASAATIWR